MRVQNKASKMLLTFVFFFYQLLHTYLKMCSNFMPLKIYWSAMQMLFISSGESWFFNKTCRTSQNSCSRIRISWFWISWFWYIFMVCLRCELVFVKDASLCFTSCGHKSQRREIVITSAKHEAERNTTASKSAMYRT